MADTMTDVERVARALFDASETTIDDWTGMAQAAIACLRSMGWVTAEEAARVADAARARENGMIAAERAEPTPNESDIDCFGRGAFIARGIAAAIRALAPKTE